MEDARQRARGLALAIGGPAAIGISVGLPFGSGQLLDRAASTPAIVLGVTLAMAPALYVGAATLGIGASLEGVMDAAIRGLRDAGVTWLGLAPALLFLLATAPEPAAWLPAAAAVVALGAVLGLRRLYLGLFSGDERTWQSAALFSAWALVSVGIGSRLFAASVAA